METKESTTKLFEQLGKVFYNVAMADKTLQEAETQQLKKEIDNYWKPEYPKNPYHIAYYIWHAFERCNREGRDAEASFKEFATYYKNNPGQFSNTTKDLILNTANAIAASFADKNKSELIYLAKLQLLLQ